MRAQIRNFGVQREGKTTNWHFHICQIFARNDSLNLISHLNFLLKNVKAMPLTDLWIAVEVKLQIQKDTFWRGIFHPKCNNYFWHCYIKASTPKILVVISTVERDFFVAGQFLMVIGKDYFFFLGLLLMLGSQGPKGTSNHSQFLYQHSIF